MISFNWPVIIVTTVVLYVLTLLSLPFNSIFATIWLFSLIGFWSKLPGYCIYEPVRLLYMMDFIDVFAIYISIYVNPFVGALYALFWNVYPKLCGPYLFWQGAIKDGLSQAIMCFFVPMMYALSGDLVLVIVLFSILRLVIFFLLSLVIPHRSIPEQIFHIVIGGIAVLIVNLFYNKLFGNFFTSLLSDGASFSWPLFFIATAVIIAFSMLVFGFSPKKVTKAVGNNIKNIVKHQIKSHAAKTSNVKEDLDEMNFIRGSMAKVGGKIDDLKSPNEATRR